MVVVEIVVTVFGFVYDLADIDYTVSMLSIDFAVAFHINNDIEY